MKVLHIASDYLNSWLYKNMIDESDKLGVQNKVITPVYSVEGHKVAPDNRVDVLRCFKKIDRVCFKYKQKKIYESIASAYNFGDFNIIHAHTLFTDGNLARRLFTEKGIPYIVAIRNTDVNVFLKYMVHLRKLGIQIMLDAKAVIFLSHAYKNIVFDKYVPYKFKDIIEAKSLVIPNGIDRFWHENCVYRNRSVAGDAVFGSDEIKIAFVGDINRNKNLYTLCQAKKLLEKQGYNVSVLVAGKIADKRLYKQVEKDIIYQGVLDKNELLKMYRACDVFVLPSHAETFGLVYAEAISQGIPVIYTRGQGFDGQFEDGLVGYSVNSREYKEIAEKIIMSVNNYKEICDNLPGSLKSFDWRVITEKYKTIYSEVIQNNGDKNDK